MEGSEVPLYQDTVISLDTVKVLNDWAQIVNTVKETDYKNLTAGSDARLQAFAMQQFVETILAADSLGSLLGKSPTTVDLTRKLNFTGEPSGRKKAKPGRGTIPEEWQTCLCYLFAAGFEQVPDINKSDAQTLAQLAGRSRLDSKAARDLNAILGRSKVSFTTGKDPESANARETRLSAGVVKLKGSIYATIPANFANTAAPVYAPLPDLTDEPGLFEYFAAQGKAISEAAANPGGVDISKLFEVPTGDSVQGSSEVEALRYINDRLYQQGDGLGAITVNGKEYLPYDAASLADKSYLCSRDGLAANYPNGYELFPELKDVLGLANYLAKVAHDAAGWEPAIKSLGSKIKTTDRLALLAIEMKNFGCKTINELKSTREVIDEAYRDATKSYFADSLPEFEDYIAAAIEAQKDKRDQNLTMKQFCERLKAAADNIADSQNETRVDVFKEVILGKEQLAAAEKRAADPVPEKNEKPEEKGKKKAEAAGHGR